LSEYEHNGNYVSEILYSENNEYQLWQNWNEGFYLRGLKANGAKVKSVSTVIGMALSMKLCNRCIFNNLVYKLINGG